MNCLLKPNHRIRKSGELFPRGVEGVRMPKLKSLKKRSGGVLLHEKKDHRLGFQELLQQAIDKVSRRKREKEFETPVLATQNRRFRGVVGPSKKNKKKPVQERGPKTRGGCPKRDFGSPQIKSENGNPGR